MPNLIEHLPLAFECSIVELTLPHDFIGKALKNENFGRMT